MRRLRQRLVWKVILLSISIVIGSFVIAGGIVAAQVLSGDFNFRDDGELDNSGQDAGSIPSNATMVSIAADLGWNSYRPDPLEVRWVKPWHG